MEDTFTYVLQHMDVSQGFPSGLCNCRSLTTHSDGVEESTREALADILTHQFREKKEKKESKQSTPLAPPIVKEIEEAFSLYFDGAYRKKEGKAAEQVWWFSTLLMRK